MAKGVVREVMARKTKPEPEVPVVDELIQTCLQCGGTGLVLTAQAIEWNDRLFEMRRAGTPMEDIFKQIGDEPKPNKMACGRCGGDGSWLTSRGMEVIRVLEWWQKKNGAKKDGEDNEAE